MTNTAELERYISLSGLKKEFIAKSLNITRQTFSRKCENKSTFSASEIKILCGLLGIDTLKEKERIFFA